MESPSPAATHRREDGRGKPGSGERTPAGRGELRTLVGVPAVPVPAVGRTFLPRRWGELPGGGATSPAPRSAAGPGRWRRRRLGRSPWRRSQAQSETPVSRAPSGGPRLPAPGSPLRSASMALSKGLRLLARLDPTGPSSVLLEARGRGDCLLFEAGAVATLGECSPRGR